MQLPRSIVFETTGVQVGLVRKDERITRIRVDSEEYRKPKCDGFDALIRWLMDNDYEPTRNPTSDGRRSGTTTRKYFFHRSLMGTIVLPESERGIRTYGA